jgi:hypothetical protein
LEELEKELEIVNEEENKKFNTKKILQIRDKNKDFVKDIDINKLFIKADDIVERMYSRGNSHRVSKSQSSINFTIANSL